LSGLKSWSPVCGGYPQEQRRFGSRHVTDAMVNEEAVQRETCGGFLCKEDELVTSHLWVGFVKNSFDLVLLLATTHDAVKIHDPTGFRRE
jgi:hypothetical protein